MLKKNILIFANPSYSLLDFYQVNLENLYKIYNFYLITDNTGLADYTLNELEELKKNNKIIDYFTLSLSKEFSKNKNINYKKQLIEAKKIYETIKNIKFDFIFTSTNYEISLNYILQKLKKESQSKLIGLPVHNFKLKNHMVEKQNFYEKIKKLLWIRTNLKKIMIYVSEIFFLFYSFLRFKEIVYAKNTNKNYPVYCNNLDFLVSKSYQEIFLYKKKFRNLNTILLKDPNDCNCNFDPQKKLLVIPKIKKRISNLLVKEYSKNILLLNKKFNFKCIDIKPHPRDDTNISEEIMSKIKNEVNQVNILEKNPKKINYCNYSCILGFTSSMLKNSISQCNNVIPLAILDIGKWTNKDPKPKYLQGDFDNFKSGILWIEEIQNIENISSSDLKLLSSELRKKLETFKDHTTFKSLLL